MLVTIVGLSLINIIVTSYSMSLNNLDYKIVNKIYIFFHSLLWLFLLRRISSLKTVSTISILIYFFVVVTDLILFNNYEEKNYYKFLFNSGAIIYIIQFLFNSFYELEKENLPFFESNNYLLIFSPFSFFLGYGVLFAFESPELNKTKAIGDFSLFEVVSNYVNVIYYTLINYYLYKISHKNV